MVCIRTSLHSFINIHSGHLFGYKQDCCLVIFGFLPISLGHFRHSKILLSDEEEKKTEDSRKMQKARLHPESVLTRDDEGEMNGSEQTNESTGNHETADQTVYTNPPSHNLTESTAGSSEKVSVTLNLEVTTISPNETDVSRDSVTDVTINVNPKILTPQGSSSLILKVSFPLLILTVLMR